MHALEICRTNGDRGDNAFDSLRFVMGFEGVMDNLAQELYETRIRREAVDRITGIELDFDDCRNVLSDADSLQEVGHIVARLKKIDGNLESLSIPDDLYDQRNTLRTLVQEETDKAKERMMELAVAQVNDGDEEVNDGEEEVNDGEEEGQDDSPF